MARALIYSHPTALQDSHIETVLESEDPKPPAAEVPELPTTNEGLTPDALQREVPGHTEGLNRDVLQGEHSVDTEGSIWSFVSRTASAILATLFNQQ